MNSLKDLSSKVRWGSVIVLLALIVLVLFIIYSKLPKYEVTGNVGLKTAVDPVKIKLGERSSIQIEVMNNDKDEKIVIDVEAKTYDTGFIFVKTSSTKFSEKNILVGPNEARKLKFEVKAISNTLPGKYRVDVIARQKSYPEGAKNTIYIDVTE